MKEEAACERPALRAEVASVPANAAATLADGENPTTTTVNTTANTTTTTADRRPGAASNETPDLAPQPAPPAPRSVQLGAFAVPLPFDCYCCEGFVAVEDEELLRHLANKNHHDAHVGFIATHGPFPPAEHECLSAFDLFTPAPPASKAALLLAKVRPKTTAGPTPPPTLSQPETPAASSLPMPAPTSDTTEPMTTTPLRPRLTRLGSGSLSRKHYGSGSPGDEQLGWRLHELEKEGKGSPVKAPGPVGSTSTTATSTLGVALPWFDFVCNRQLSTEEEARNHFEEPGHRQEVEAFLAKHQAKLEAREPESIKMLLATLPARPRQTLAERLATTDRASSGPTAAPRHALPRHAAGSTLSAKQTSQEELGRWAATYGRERTMPSRETSPEEHVYLVGVEETRQWQGNFAAMPCPAFCNLCQVRIPHSHQAVMHLEGAAHRAKIAAAGDKMIAKSLIEHRSSSQSDYKVSFTALPPGAGGRTHPARRTSPPPARARTSPAAQVTQELPCAGADCRGRVTFPVGDPNAKGRCKVCNFKQSLPVRV